MTADQTNLHPTFDRILAEHLGVGGPRPAFRVEAMVTYLRSLADDEVPADDAFCFREIADRLEDMKIALGAIHAHLATAKAQRAPSDDKIIGEHINVALALAEAALKGA